MAINITDKSRITSAAGSAASTNTGAAGDVAPEFGGETGVEVPTIALDVTPDDVFTMSRFVSHWRRGIFRRRFV
jgi:hypothetical protein